MYCSVKFLSPIVTAGLPLPGCEDCAAVEDVVLSLSSDEPQAASDSASAAAISAAMLRNQVRDVMGFLLGKRRLGGHPASGVGLQFGVVHAGAQATRGHQALGAGEEGVD